MPLISIIIPTFNRAHLIAETLDSIIAQTHTNWECIVIDDGSKDSTADVMDAYCKKDSRFQYHSRPKEKLKGPSSCRNFGFTKSKGDYINWFDSDDLMLPNKLEVDLKNITSGNYDFTISQTQFFDTETKERKGFWNDRLYSKNPINDFILQKTGWSTNSPLWKIESLLKTNLLFDERLITADDYFYHIQALGYGLKPLVNNQILVKQRIHSGRLENYNVKSSYKLIVLQYLIKNCMVLKLNNNTLEFIKNQIKSQLANLYKNKEWREAVRHSFLVTKHLNIVSNIRLFLAGTFFKVTSKGYKFIK